MQILWYSKDKMVMGWSNQVEDTPDQRLQEAELRQTSLY